jgi:hypothetical protein
MFQVVFGFLKSLFGSKESMFIFSILFNWYFIIMSTAMLTTYYFFKGLSDSGVLKKLQDFIFPILYSTVNIARECTPEILNLNEFFSCVGRF